MSSIFFNRVSSFHERWRTGRLLLTAGDNLFLLLREHAKKQPVSSHQAARFSKMEGVCPRAAASLARVPKVMFEGFRSQRHTLLRAVPTRRANSAWVMPSRSRRAASIAPRRKTSHPSSNPAANRESLFLRLAIYFPTSLPGSFFILMLSVFCDRDFLCGSRLRFLCKTVRQYQFSTCCCPTQQLKDVPRMADANFPEIVSVDHFLKVACGHGRKSLNGSQCPHDLLSLLGIQAVQVIHNRAFPFARAIKIHFYDICGTLFFMITLSRENIFTDGSEELPCRQCLTQLVEEDAAKATAAVS